MKIKGAAFFGGRHVTGFKQGIKGLLLGCASLGALVAVSTAAQAGGFALREQSAYGEGTSYAGVAAGGALSSMFWNPAVMTQFQGLQTESVLTGILPRSSNNATSGTLLATGGTGNIANSALVPSSYFSWQFNPKMWLGLSVNSPFGLSESFPDNWAGRDYGAGGSNLSTYNATPSFAYEVNNWISVGVGIQAQYANATLTKGYANVATWQTSISGAGWGYGFTAGVTLKPTVNTTIGLGYRSAINQKINGTLAIPPGAAANSTPGSVATTLNLPGTLSLGLRQQLSSKWTAMATIEWTNWSRIGTSNVTQPNGAIATVGANGNAVPVTIPFNYKDGWFYSVGAEYQWTDKVAVRAGVGYEKSPITDDVRIPLLADNDRYWLSAGATYKFSPKLSLDFAYSHLFVKSTPINIVDATNPSFNGAITYTGTVNSQIDIVSVGLKYRWDDPAPRVKQVYAK